MMPHNMMMHPKLLDQPIISLRDEFMPECYAATMPHIRACKTSARWTGRLQVAGISREGTGDADRRAHITGVRLQARGYIRG